MLEIKTSPELIRMLGKRLYSNPLATILLRELLQNAIDASQKTSVPVDVRFTRKEDNSISIRVTDQGIGMDYDTLTNVFLVIGESRKMSDQSIGGFGVAKVSLFASDTWMVHTRDHLIDQSLHYKQTDPRIGTDVQATINDDYYATGRSSFQAIVNGNEYPIRVNGSIVPPYEPDQTLSTGETSHGVPYTVSFGSRIPSVTGYAIYRINGLVQFITYLGGGLEQREKNLIIDFRDISTRPSGEDYPFSMSRESVEHSVTRQISEIMTVLNKDTLSGFSNDPDIIRVTNERTGLVSESVTGKPYKPSTRDRRIASLYGLMIEDFLKFDDSRLSVSIGVTNDPDTNGSHQAIGDAHLFMINPENLIDQNWTAVKHQDTFAFLISLYHLASHEYTHLHYGGHDESFTSGHSANATRLAVPLSMNRAEYLRRIRQIMED